ncbi:MAG: hypothetical protein AAF467_04385 [Actinomycetota bacterium]
MGDLLLKVLAVPIMAVAILGAAAAVPMNSLPAPVADAVSEHIGVEAADAATKKCISASRWFGCTVWQYKYSPRETEIILGGATAAGGLYTSGMRAAAYAAAAFGVGVWRAGHCLYVNYAKFFIPVGAGFYRC